MAKRYELSDASWEMIKDLITLDQKTGRPRNNDRLMLNGILWVLCSGATWRDMPERFGPWSTVYQRFRDWRNRGTFDQMLKRLNIKLNEQGLIDLDTWMVDSTTVRATRASSGVGKKGTEEPLDHELGLSRSGLTTKIHRFCDSNGIPLCFNFSDGQASDIAHAQPLLDRVQIPSSQRGRSRKRCRWLLADKGYDAEHLRRYNDRYRMQPDIPLRCMKRKPKPGLPRLLDKLAKNFGAMVSLACAMRCLRHYFSYTA
ncbi:IS5 family transposase [Pseudomonas wadenswilerensis]